MVRSLSCFLAFAVFAVANISAANADIVAEYDFSSIRVEGGELFSDAINVSPFFTADPYNANIGPAASGISGGSAFMNATRAPATFNAPGSNAFQSFAIEVDTMNWDIDSVSFDYFVTGIQFGGSQLRVGLFYVAQDNSRILLTQQQVDVTENNDEGTDTDPVRVVANLQGNSLFQNLGPSDRANFELYFSDNVTGLGAHRIDDIRIDASLSAVPEPSSAGLVGMFVGIAALVRRRKKV